MRREELKAGDVVFDMEGCPIFECLSPGGIASAWISSSDKSREFFDKAVRGEIDPVRYAAALANRAEIQLAWYDGTDFPEGTEVIHDKGLANSIAEFNSRVG